MSVIDDYAFLNDRRLQINSYDLKGIDMKSSSLKGKCDNLSVCKHYNTDSHKK